MKARTLLFLALSATLSWGTMLSIASQMYPAKPVRIIVPFPAGGNADILARILGQKLTVFWGQQVIIDNRAGAAGIIGAQAAAKAAPDGYTLFLGTTGTQTTNPAVYAKLPYQPLVDFAPVSNFAGSPYVLVVHPSLPVHTVKDLTSFAKAHPGALHYASFGTGSSAHLTGEMLRSMAKIDIVHVPYKGGPPALADLIGGHVAMMFNLLPGILPHIKPGKLRALAVAAEKRAQAISSVPTFAESGMPNLLSDSWYGILAPAGTAKEIIAKINAEIQRVLAMPDVKERLASDGAEPLGNTPEQFAQQIRNDLARYTKIAAQAGVKVQ